jgi:flavin-dependent dehydrogenase
MNELDQTHWDAVVVGAGVAGGIVAANLSKLGWRVLLLEKSKWPREKVCGGCLNAKAVAMLETAGLRSVLRGSQSINNVAWYVGNQSLEMDAPGGVAILRSELDERIVASAVERGCAFYSGVKAKLLPADDSQPTAPTPILPLSTRGGSEESRTLELRHSSGTVNVHANVVLACDGISGTLLADEPWANWSVARGGWMGVSTTCESWPSNAEAGCIHMHVGSVGYVGLVRVPDQKIHLAAALDPAATRNAGGPAALLERIIRSCGCETPKALSENSFRGTPTLTRHRKTLAGHRVLAIGDACGYVEPFTGEGMAWAIAGAQAAISLLPSPGAPWPADMPMRWQQAHQSIVGKNQFWCGLLKPMMHHPTFASAGVAVGRIIPMVARFLASRVCPAQSRSLLPAQGDLG